MTAELSPIDKAKYVAARRAVDFVEDGMRVGLGTGSTAAWMVRCLGELVREDGMKITGVATSPRTAQLAAEVGLTVKTLDEVRWLDLTIDGADEYDANLNLIKLELTGQQIYDLLNQQWESRNDQGRVLQVSGLSYTWDASKPPGQRIVAIMKDKEPLHTEALYTVTVNEYLINGGGHFTVLSRAANPVIGPFVADVLHQYVQQLPQPLKAEIDGRICRLH